MHQKETDGRVVAQVAPALTVPNSAQGRGSSRAVAARRGRGGRTAQHNEEAKEQEWHGGREGTRDRRGGEQKEAPLTWTHRKYWAWATDQYKETAA
eukprot:7626404-Pyramimonas_sp.AAC.1